MKISIAHSPDTDDYVMFHALRTGKVKTPCSVSWFSSDIETLNQMAFNSVYDITAVSFFAATQLTDPYDILSSGVSVAERDYGPILVSHRELKREDLKHVTVALPGEHTTAAMLFKIEFPDVPVVYMNPDQILNGLKNKSLEAGVLIHEGQLHYKKMGLHPIHPLLETWRMHAGVFPLPLGGNAIRRDFAPELKREWAGLCEDSVHFALKPNSEIIAYARSLQPDLSEADVRTYLSWYVNERTMRIDEYLKKSILTLFNICKDRGLCSQDAEPHIVYGANL